MQLIRVSIALILLLSCQPLLQARTAYGDYMVQAPKLEKPQAGAIVGAFSQFAPNAESMNKGSTSIPLKLNFDQQRGPLLVDMKLSYNMGQGLTPFGMGFDLPLSITRNRLQGALRYDSTDEWISPWGPLKKGLDGYWYSQGLTDNVRVAISSDRAIVFSPDQKRYEFTEIEEGFEAGSVYAYHLTSVEDAAGWKTLLRYSASEAGQKLLQSIVYGSRSTTSFPYELTFQYTSLDYSSLLFGFTSGTGRMMDQRLVSIDFKLQSRLRYSYTFNHEFSSNGPAFYLTSVQKVFASGSKDPAQKLEFIQSEPNDWAYRAYQGFDALMERYGNDILNSSRVTFYDHNLDGLIDIEVAEDHSLWLQTADGFVLSGYRERSSKSDVRCLTGNSSDNVARKIMRLESYRSDPKVVVTENVAGTNNTRLVVCDLDGNLQSTQEFPLDLRDSRWIRMVDLNRDGRVDLAALQGNQLRVLENQSAQGQVSFVLRPTITVALDSPADTVWFDDVNGDGLVDLLLQKSGGFEIHFGYTDFGFLDDSFFMETTDLANSAFKVQGYSVQFHDFNGDGLADLLLSRNREIFFFYNSSRGFKQVALPTPQALELSGEVLAQELGASGNPLIIRSNGKGSAEVLSLAAQGEGLLASWDDGQGSRLSFHYGRGPAYAGQATLPRVMQSMSQEAVGLGTMAYRFSYDRPYYHSLVGLFMGFRTVSQEQNLGTQTVQFIATDDYSGMVVSSVTHDARTELDKKVVKSYDLRKFQGIPFLEIREEQHILAKGQDQSVKVKTQGPRDANLCATESTEQWNGTSLKTTTEYQVLDGFKEYMLCLPAKVKTSGRHGDATFDFDQLVTMQRDALGRMTQLQTSSLDGKQSLVLQKIVYDSENRVASISSHEGLVSNFGYDGRSNLLNKVSTNIGYVESISARNDRDQIEAYTMQQGGGSNWTTFYRFDDRDRLAKSWDNFAGSEAEALDSWDYVDASLDRLAAITHNEWSPELRQTFASTELYTASGQKVAQVFPFKGRFVHTSARLINPAEGKATAFSSTSLEGLGTLQDLQSLPALTREEKSILDLPLRTTQAVSTSALQTTTYKYSIQQGLFVSEETSNGIFKKTRVKDADDKVVATVDEGLNRSNFRYDALGRLRLITLPDGVQHRVEIDGLGRTSRIVRDRVGSVAYGYDGQSRLVSKQYFDITGLLDRSCQISYDSFGRKISEVWSRGAETEAFSYYYDGMHADGRKDPGQIGKLTEIRGPRYTKTFAYDARDKLIEETQVNAWNPLRPAVTLSRRFAYDSRRQVIEETRTLSDGQKSIKHAKSYQYDASGRMLEVRLGGKILSRYSYDSLGQLEDIDNQTASVHLKYDKVTGMRSGYQYYSAVNPAESFDYSMELDDRGLIVAERYENSQDKNLHSYSFDERRFLVSSRDNGKDRSYSYDANGLMKSPYEDQYSFDSAGRIVKSPDAAFQIGAKGRPSRLTNGTGKTEYTYDENDDLIGSSSDSQSLAIFGSSTWDGSTFRERVETNGQLLGYIENGRFQAATSDFRSTPIGLGGKRSVTGPYGENLAASERNDTLSYAGHGKDSSSGLIRMGIRFYDTRLGRFTSPDPEYLENPESCVENALECNLYSYAMNNPLQFVDPTGRKAATFELTTIFGIKIFEVRDDGKGTKEIDNNASPASLNTGMGNTAEEQKDSAERKGRQLGRPVIYVQNETKGGFLDVLVCIIVKLGFNTAQVDATKAIITGDIRGSNGRRVTDMYAHSQGSIYVTEAMSELKSSEKRGIVSLTYYGNASWTTPSVAEGTRFWSHVNIDYVTIPFGNWYAFWHTSYYNTWGHELKGKYFYREQP